MTNRPIILVDLDNVVYDWCKTMAQWLDLNGVIDQDEAMASYSQWAVWEDWNIPKGEFVRWWRLGIEKGWIYGLGPEIPGARDALWKLSDAEWHIHIATSRLTKFGLHDKVVENTASWLREHNIPYRDLSFVSDKKRLLADAIVDDRFDNCSETAHRRIFHFAAPHNSSDITWNNIVPELLEPYRGL